MLRLGRHGSTLKACSLRQPAAAYARATRPSSIWRRDPIVPSGPHDNIVRGITTNTFTNTTTNTEQQRSVALSRWIQADRRRGPHVGPAPAASVTQLQQWRGLASGSSGKGKGGEEEGGMFDRLKKTFTEEIDKNPSLKESLSKLKDAEQKLRENPSVKENLAKLKEAEKKFRENPSVQENLSKLKDAEKKWREDAKSKQGEFAEQAEKAREKAQQGGGAFQEKFQELKQTLEEKLGKVGGESGDGKDGGEGKDGAENEFVRASKEKFSGAQKALDENSLFSKLRVKTQAFREAVAGASSELFPSEGQKAESAVVKKLKQPKKEKKKKKKKKDGKEKAPVEGEDDEEEEEEEEEKGGMGSLMIVKTAGEAWERLQERLKESPIIQDLLGASRVVASGSLGQGAKSAKDTVKDKVEDVQEAWETSQHPLVYKLSSAWDSLTAESDEGIGVRELRRLDPSFSVEDWKRDIQELFLPEFMSAFLRGDVKLLKQWTGEACYNKLASEAKQRKADGMVLDPHVLDIRQGEVLAIKADAGKANPTIALQFMCQQINCVRNKKGEILEGAEDDIRATYYILAFQREFNDDEAELRWRVVDMMVVGAFPWY
ncbi:Import inner membrane translocase subunit TIM44, mitochondrial precursor [Ectocarpus siliculosus]|uniref:Import inner membrane translocase subunit TIM44, mitochondrial n=1 Tax=Ectocarpus siliculosus TaxID=2880 RepID=D7G7Z7_ECTSI|nr:Import inner membrane translocase subunit TIM44, mitochondrial precursor [Ectocarpus siliculosus]|eukprot:CBJ27872.1 Import inner membrane translocase subunit TIM44, mitochondrial precursor [Ectocarpus siliculosus]